MLNLYKQLEVKGGNKEGIDLFMYDNSLIKGYQHAKASLYGR